MELRDEEILYRGTDRGGVLGRPPRWAGACAAAMVALGILFGCASQVRVAPIKPYVDPSLGMFNVRSVAVMPFVIPDYLGYAEGGSQVSVQLTNDMMRRLDSLQLYHVMNTAEVKRRLADEVRPLAEWIFTGTREEALAVGQVMQADGVLYQRVFTYRQGNLIDSEVELEVTLIDVVSGTTVWSIRENVRGKPGKASLNQPVRAPAAARLAQVAIENVATKVGKIARDGGDFEVVSVSPRRIAGFTLLGVGVASTAVAGYSYYEAQRSYSDYKNASDPGKVQRLRTRTEDYDTLTWIFGTLAVGSLGAATFLLVTDEPYDFQAAAGWLDEKGIGFAPMVVPGGGGVLAQFRF